MTRENKASPPPPLPLVLVIDGPRGQEKYSFAQPVITIGRSLDNDLALEDRQASRRHCRIEQVGGLVYLQDSGSQNRTRLNGAAVDRAELHYGDTVQVGGTRIRIEKRPDRDLGKTVTTLTDDTQMKQSFHVQEDLLALTRITQALNSEHDIQRLLTLIVDSAIELTTAERGFLIVGRGNELTFEIARNFAKEEIESPEFKISRTIADDVRRSGEPRLTVNAQTDERWKDAGSITDLKLRSIIAVPLRVRGELEGVLYVDNRLKQHAFVEEDKERMLVLADQAGIAIHNARTMGDLKHKQEALLAALSRVEELNARLEGRVKEQQEAIEQMQEDLHLSRRAFGLRHEYKHLIGQSRRMKELFQLLDRYIGSEDPVVILGESGTGKELIARAIHTQGRRKDGPFVSENCAALTESLLESELFGYVRGAFTGARGNKRGLFEAASGGTLFLDEVGDMSVDLQKKLLRVLQEGEVRPLGSDKVVKVDVRLITATNRDLEELVRDGDFREDLFYRLNVLPVRVPPLRERKEDIPLLLAHFLRQTSQDGNKPTPKVDPSVLNLLTTYRWPGNVRELENEIKRAVILAEGVIMPEHLSAAVRQQAQEPVRDDGGPSPIEAGTTLPEMVRTLEVREIQRALEKAKNNKSRAAELLGLSRFALQRKMEKYFLAEGGEAPAPAEPPDEGDGG
jgi:transcriptional regulator with GAF, ATPase, and Fis domain